MSLLDQNGTPMRKICLGLLGLAVSSGCSAFGPNGTNTSTTVYKTVDDGGLIVLTVPKPSEDAAKAVFVLRNKGDVEFEDIPDDSPDGGNAGTPCEDVEGFCASFDPKDLPPNVYLMDVYIDDEDQTTPAATIPFLVGGEAAADEDASGEGDGEDGGEDGEAPADEEEQPAEEEG